MRQLMVAAFLCKMYKEKDFNNLQFNPLCEKGMLETYPILNHIVSPEIKSGADTDMLLRYIILCYDPKSRLVMDEKDLNHRKSIAAEYAQLMGDKEYLQEVFTFGLKRLAEMTVKYLIRFVRSKEWAAIVSIEFKYWENISELITPIVGTTNKERLEAAQKKSIISDEVEKDIKRIDSLYKSFFGDDDLESAIKQSPFTAERIAFGHV